MISRQFVDDSLTVITEVLTRTGHTGTGDQIIWYVGGPDDSHILVEVTKAAADAELARHGIGRSCCRRRCWHRGTRERLFAVAVGARQRASDKAEQ